MAVARPTKNEELRTKNSRAAAPYPPAAMVMISS